jgi:class 3 adenylate cyclase
LLGFSEGAALSCLFAATYPERTTALILYEGVVTGPKVEGLPPDARWVEKAQIVRETIDRWGEGTTMRWVAPSLPETGVERRFWAMFERASMSPGLALSLWQAIEQVDVRNVMPSVRVPTLVLNHAGSLIPAWHGRLAADLIPDARYVELPGRDHLPGSGDPEAVAGEIEEFLTGTRPGARPDRVLATVLFTDIAESTRRATEIGDTAWRQLLERHDAMVRLQLERFRGREVKQTGDGFLASFDGPARAIRCACSIGDEANDLGIEIRAGLHTGECELIGDDIGGVAVHVAARVGAVARPGEVLVSGTVKDLVLGSGIELVDRGIHELKGVPGKWQLFAVRTHDTPTPSATAASASTADRLNVTDRAGLRLARWAPGVARTGARVLRRRRAKATVRAPSG